MRYTISEQTIDLLKKHAKPLETTDDVIVRHVQQCHDTSSQRTHLRQNEYRIPLMEVLYDAKGKRLSMRESVAAVGEKMRAVFGPSDYELVDDMSRWQKMVKWTRYYLVQDGYLKRDSRRGIWELSDLGIRFIEQHRRLPLA